MTTIRVVREEYKKFFVQQKSTIRNHAELLKKLLPKGPLWNIELPLEAQIKFLSLPSKETFGSLIVNKVWSDWSWQPATYDFGLVEAGYNGTGAIHTTEVAILNNNEFPVTIETYGWINDSGGNKLTMSFPYGSEIPANDFLNVQMRLDLRTQTQVTVLYQYRPFVVNSNMPTQQLFTEITAEGYIPA